MMFYYTNETFRFFGWDGRRNFATRCIYDSAKIGLNFNPVKFDLL